jgi:hypothetical protein
MPRLKAPGVAPIKMPARADVATVTEIRRIETETGDRRENMAVT